MLKDRLARLLRGRGENADERSQGALPRKRSTRNYYALPRRWLYIAAACAAGIVLVFSAVQLALYASDYFAAQQVSDDLREIYYSGETTAPPADEAEAVPEESGMEESSPTPLPVTSPAAAAQRRLESIPYPENPYAVVNDRFKALQRQNADIIAWLKASTLVDDPVVQRDNSYYLRRDYLGYHNQNGALFLDENCMLKTRPYTLMVYGHNMQTGAMFGSLRKYENKNFLLSDPFIDFDTAYEPGRYVIFSVGTISTNSRDSNYVNLAMLNAATVSYREKAIAGLQSHSVFTNVLDVKAEDQILLLITCVDDSDERRIVCARRIRDGESETALRRQLNMMWEK